tara:strand:+ start:140 stop:508 length:369 start_codon:yes stop_codon:yes gene_type:complete
MKRFLPLFIITGLLFGQDVLTLNNRQSFDGTFYGKVGEDIVFKVEGELNTKKYSINNVKTIVTENGELHTFDLITNIEKDFSEARFESKPDIDFFSIESLKIWFKALLIWAIVDVVLYEIFG